MHFLFTLSLLIILLFVGMLWTERARNRRTYKNTAVAYFIVSLFICYVFTTPVGENILFDVRNIPVMIGGLYMGLGPLLSILTITIRGFYGLDSGLAATFLLYGCLAFLLWRLSPWFLKRTAKQRVLIAIGLTFIISTLTVSGTEFLNTPYPVFDVMLAYMVIQPLGVGMISCLIEMISHNVLIRQNVVKSERLEAVEQMGAAISHEIRNPLTSAMGFVQLLQDESIPSEQRVQYLAILKDELESAERIIQDYLLFSKPQIESIVQLNVHDELYYVLKLLQPLTNWGSVEVNTTFSCTGLIDGNKPKFHQCFINIIKNAIESMPNGGCLTVETKIKKCNVHIRIQDTGGGMTKEQLDRLGEPYYSTKGARGTGLGVMVAFSIVRAMNGTIHVQSEIGKGTVFEFSFQPSTIDTNKHGNDVESSVLVANNNFNLPSTLI